MSYYIVKNRYGTYYFRFVIPKIYRHLFSNKREIRRTLVTDSKKIAKRRARIYRSKVDSLLEHLEKMSDEGEEGYIQTGFIEFIDIFGKKTKVDYDGDEEKELKVKKQIERDNLELAREIGLNITGSNIEADTSSYKQRNDSPTWEHFSEAYKDELVKRNRIRADTANEYSAHYKALSRFAGNDLRLDEFTDEVLIGFYDSMRDKTVTTRNKYMTRISSVFDYAVKKKIITVNPVSAVITERDVIRDRDKRDLFSDDDLKAIFESDYYKNNQWRNRRRKVRTPYTFWMFPLALFTGARLAELLLIETNNVVTEDGLTYLNLMNEFDPSTGETILKLKNKNSIRKIPVSEALVDMGFLRFVDYCKKNKQKYLFPDIQGKVTTKDAGQKVLGSRLKEMDVWVHGRKSFHSLRHTFINTAVICGVDRTYLGAVTGHLNKSELDLVPELANTYFKEYPIQILKSSVIDKMKFNIDLSCVRWPE